MDISNSPVEAVASTGSELGIKLLKKAQEQGNSSLELIKDLPSPSPEGVGTKVDVSG